jgi:hypothetical protein
MIWLIKINKPYKINVEILTYTRIELDYIFTFNFRHNFIIYLQTLESYPHHHFPKSTADQ